MKIVHLTSYINGGAGTSAYRIHEAMLDQGIASTLICFDEPNKISRNIVVIPQKQKSLLNRVISKVKRSTARYFRLNGFNHVEFDSLKLNHLKSKMVFECAFLPYSESEILNNPFVVEADIIHLHWVAGMIGYENFFAKNSKPVVWTLHDENPLLGIFHYSNDKIRNETVAGDFENEIQKLKRESIVGFAGKLAVVAPSIWLFNEAKKADVFKGRTFSYIPYTLNTSIFKFRDTSKLRSELNIPLENNILLFVTQSVYNYRKGFDLLKEALGLLGNKRNLTLLIVGYSDKADFGGYHVIHLGLLKDEVKLSEIYSLADAFVLPSREDNLPNVMLESLACGTPVISFNVGGIPDFCVSEFNAVIAGEVSGKALHRAIVRFFEIKESFDRNKIIDNLRSKTNALQIVDKYREIYSGLTS